MSRYIARRDPTRPAFWYMSFLAPHPPLVPLEGYMNIYRDIDVPMPFVGDWAKEFDSLPLALKARPTYHWKRYESEANTVRARRAFYAMSTHVDHQIRAVIGTLREQGLVDNTIIIFTSDHGDILGDHRLWKQDALLRGLCQDTDGPGPHGRAQRASGVQQARRQARCPGRRDAYAAGPLRHSDSRARSRASLWSVTG